MVHLKIGNIQITKHKEAQTGSLYSEVEMAHSRSS